jgi:response regulator RpfG family c-di-GMP phosphodiesterase/HAMP domain-containing protein
MFSKIDIKLLKGKVSDRIIILFIVSALVPIAAVALISFSSVKKQLNEDSHRRLHKESKALGMGVYERLLFLKSQMKDVSISQTDHDAGVLAPDLVEQLKHRFKSMWLLNASGRERLLFGSTEQTPDLGTEELTHLDSGKSIVFTIYHPNNASKIFMMSRANSSTRNRGLLVAEINNKYLWGITYAGLLPHMTELTILDASRNRLRGSPGGPVFFTDKITKKMDMNSTGLFEWRHNDSVYLSSYWTIFLKSEFLNPGWTVLLSEPKSYTLAPMADFKRTFPLVIILSLLIIAFMSIRQIRRHLVPLKKLQEGTRRIANREFNCRVDVTSGDEFEELATSFNTMAERLAKQFNALSTLAEVDRAILATTDTEKITETIITRMQDIAPSDSLSVALLGPDAGHEAVIYLRNSWGRCKKLNDPVSLTDSEVETLNANPQGLIVTSRDVGLPKYLVPMAKAGVMTYFVTPVFVQWKLRGVISLAWLGSNEPGEEDKAQVRQFANQVAVALSNARLIEELDELSWGTLTALARTVDAKSPWTAGHSERVTKLTLKVGSALGLQQRELDNLQRAGLMHDIGKIGIPPEILDKRDALTSEEMALIREHPAKGKRILEPIKAYADIIPMVSEHHERYDGNGYPRGLKGDEISLGGRILALSDVYDAIISERPYRAAMEKNKVVAFITSMSGTQFDPLVVEAFLKVLAEEERAGPELSKKTA